MSILLSEEYILSILNGITCAEIRVSPDVEGGFAVYVFGMPRYEGGWAKQTAIMVDKEQNLTLYLRDRRIPGAICEDLSIDNLLLAKERIIQFLNEETS